jgi:CRP/FNR family cyclic AMP-dependent transcriptional regulator
MQGARRSAAFVSVDSVYDPRVALAFFKAAGKGERVAAGTTLFREKEKGSRLLAKGSKMYLLLKGEIALMAGKKEVGAVSPGEVFGELAAITDAPRSATAVAKTDCTVIALDAKQFAEALRKKPVFALMLMSMMVKRLRDTIAQLAAEGELSADKAAKEGVTFNAKHLVDLAKGLSDDPPVYYDRNKVIVQAGQKGVRMYVVTEGRAVVKMGERIVERLGPGGVFGEAALVDQSARLATVVAETDCALLPITRNGFLGLVKMSPGFAESMLGSLAERVRFLTARMH